MPVISKKSDSVQELMEAGEACGLTREQIIDLVEKKKQGLYFCVDRGEFVSKQELSRFAKAGNADDCGHEVAGHPKGGKFTEGNTCAGEGGGIGDQTEYDPDSIPTEDSDEARDRSQKIFRNTVIKYITASNDIRASVVRDSIRADIEFARKVKSAIDQIANKALSGDKEANKLLGDKENLNRLSELEAIINGSISKHDRNNNKKHEDVLEKVKKKEEETEEDKDEEPEEEAYEWDSVSTDEYVRWDDLSRADQREARSEVGRYPEGYAYRLNEDGTLDYIDEEEAFPRYEYDSLSNEDWTRWEDLSRDDQREIRSNHSVGRGYAYRLNDDGEVDYIDEEEAFPPEDEDDDGDILEAGKYKYKLSGNQNSTAKSIKETAKRIFGKEMELDEILKFTAIDALSDQFPDFAPTISLGYYDKNIEIKYEKSGEIDIAREIKIMDGKPYIYNEHQYLSKRHQGQGLGIKVFTEQVEAAIKHGVETIHCTAGKSSDMNGYITWPKFGYDGEIKIGEFEDLHKSGLKSQEDMVSRVMELTGKTEEELKSGEGKISDLMKTKEGTEFWAKHGYQFSADFDVTEGSLSRRVLSAYLKYKGIDKEDSPDRFRKKKRISR